jgi:multiple sugar transport system substrate-binding protein
MKSKWRKWTAVVLSLAGLAGCSRSGGAKSPEAAQGAAETVVDVWCWEAEEYQKPLFEEFNKMYPNIRIHNTLVQQAEMPVKVQTTLASGSEIGDMVWLEINVRGKLLALDCWDDLTKAPYNLDTNKLFSNMLPLTTTPKGVLAGIDAAPAMSGIGYKRGLAREYFGVDDVDQVAGMFKTWDDFIVKGREVSQKSGGKVYMFAGLMDLFKIFQGQTNIPFLVNNDTLNLKEALGPSFDLLIKFKESGIVDGLQQSSPAWNASITDKTHLFMPMPEWGPSWIVKINDPEMVNTWGMFTPPGGSYPMGGTAWAIPKAAKDKEAAWTWMSWNLLGGPNDPGPIVRRDKADIYSSNKALFDPALKFYSKPDPYFGGQDVALYLTTVLAPATPPSRQVCEYDSEINDAISLAVTELTSAKGKITSDQLIKMMEDDLLQRLPNLKKR